MDQFLEPLARYVYKEDDYEILAHDFAKLFSKPNLESEVLEKFNKDDIVYYYPWRGKTNAYVRNGVQYHWVQVKSNSKIGFVSDEFLREKSEEEDNAALAMKILGYSKIRLLNWHLETSRPVTDKSTAHDNITDTAAGKQAKRSDDGHLGGGYVDIDERVLRAILSLSEDYGPIQVTTIVGGRHSAGSSHYYGRALDIDMIRGTAVSGLSTSLLQEVENFAYKTLGVNWVGNRISDPPEYCKLSDHHYHNHFQWK